MKNKAFTLIELLAVIIILGILMLVAIPSVTGYINNSRKETYVTTVKELIKGASTLVNEGKIDAFDTDTTYYIPISAIKLENGEAKSPYGTIDEAYVVVTYDGEEHNYYYLGKDETDMGIAKITKETDVSSDKIENTDEEINTDAGIGKRDDIIVFDDNFNISSSGIASRKVDEDTGEDLVIVCIRADRLHTNTCTRLEWNGCKLLFNENETYNYGNLGRKGNYPVVGDAFDCDVDYDGYYDSETERFYYVTNNGDDMVFIYYTNVIDGITPTSSNSFKYDISSYSYYGPRDAYEQLPSIEQWSSPGIKRPTNRKIITELGTNRVGDRYSYTTIKDFKYTDRAARFLTTQEVEKGCMDGAKVGNHTNGELSKCYFFGENIEQFEMTNGRSYGFWLETPVSIGQKNVWHVSSSLLSIYNSWANHSEGVRPVIDVSKKNVYY